MILVDGEKFSAWMDELEELRVVAEKDAEYPHSRADQILCEVLRYMHPACAEIADKFESIRKWYA